MRNPFTTNLSLSLTLATCLVACGGGGGGGAGDQAPEQGGDQKAPSATASTVSADPLAGLVANGTDVSTISVQVMDAEGNPLSERQIEITVSGTGNVLDIPSEKTGTDGKWVATLATTVAEPKDVSITVDPTETPVALETRVTVDFLADVSPRLAGAAIFEDRNGNALADAGDAVIVGFDVEVSLNSPSAADFVLPVTGDSFGTGATVQTGSTSSRVEVVLGASPVLRSRGLFSSAEVTPNSPSGIALASGISSIVSTSSGTAATSGETVDVAPGFGLTQSSSSDANDVAFGDFDMNGHMDAIFAQDGTDQIAFNDGTGILGTPQALTTTGTQVVVAADMNNTGRTDILFGSNGTTTLFRNNSIAGSFDLDEGTQITTGDTRALLTVDLDADGFFDVVSGSTNDVRSFRNGRNLGVALNLTSTVGTLTVSALEALDANGDGNMDVAVASIEGPGVILLGDGTGVLLVGSALPAGISSLSASDVDRDGDQDLVIAMSGEAKLLRNSGGIFSEESLSGISAQEVALRDLDGDGRSDLITGGEELRQHMGDGAGSFLATGTARTISSVNSMRISDFDRDGDYDVGLALDASAAQILDGSLAGSWGSFTYTETQQIGTESSTCVAFGDLDGDGDRDAVVGNIGADHVLFNDGEGNLTHTGATGQTLNNSINTNRTLAVALGDIDGDGDLDIVQGAELIGGVFGRNTIWENDGNGNFSEALFFGAEQTTRDVDILDIDGDGQLDIVCANDGPNRIYLNTSTPGAFAVNELDNGFLTTNQNDEITHALAFGDLDGDGDIDAIAGNQGPNGTGAFDQVWRFANGRFSHVDDIGSPQEATADIQFVDVDGDGALDVVAAYVNINGNFPSKVFPGNKRSIFFQPPVEFTNVTGNITSVEAVDVDGDRDLDLVVGARSGGSRIWIQNGPMGFGDFESVELNDDTTLAIRAADLDDDGDAELFAANQNNQPNRLFKNL